MITINMHTVLKNVPVSKKIREHTLMRCGYMTEEQLWTRLYRMTNLEKLVAFYELAHGLGYFELKRATAEKIKNKYI